MSTLKEVAKRAGVSTATVSHVINGTVRVSPELRRRIETVIRELEYHPSSVARSLRTKRTHLLGLIISDVTNPFYPQLARGVEDAALQGGYLVITINTDNRLERESSIFSMPRSRRLDGILLVPAPNEGNTGHLSSAIRAGVHLVCLDRVFPELPVDSVTATNRIGARECITHMIKLGHRRIGVISGHRSLFYTADERVKGYEDALREAGIPIDRDLLREGDYRFESGRALCLELMRLPDHPTALFASNNTTAVGALAALREMNLRCPSNVAMAAFDDLPYMSAINPSLTSVAQPAYEIGFQGARLLLRRIAGEEKYHGAIAIQLPTVLMIRESTTGEGYERAIAGGAGI